MEELRKFQSSTFDTIARPKISRGSGHYFGNLLARYRNCRMKLNCMNDSRDFQDAESVRSGNSHVTSRPVSFPPYPIPGGMLSRSLGMPSRKDGPPSIWDTHGISGNVVANPPASSTAPYPQELNPWSSGREETIRSSTAEKNEFKIRDASLDSQPKILSSSKNFGADQQRLQISDLHFDKFPTPATFACWKIRFRTEVCTCSQFPTEGYALDQRSGDG